MASIDLPRALPDYFGFAETTPTRHGRRFSITLPYIRADGCLDKLQWWYHLSSAQEMTLGEGAEEKLRAEAIARFSQHIERWLQNMGQVLYGDGAIPRLAVQGQRIGTQDTLSVAAANPCMHDPAQADTPQAAAPESDAAAASPGAAGTPATLPLPAGKTAFG